MIRHTVIWKLKAFADGQDRAANLVRMKNALDGLPAKIRDIKRFDVGINTMSPEANDHIVLVSEFDSKDALERYLKHPDHIAVGDLVAKLRDTRACVDYEF